MIEEKPRCRAVIGGRKYTVEKKICSDGAVEYSFLEDGGDAQMRVYQLSPGIKLIYHSVHTDRSYLGTAQKKNVIEIHHCREGRMECAYQNGYLYLMPGDLAIEIAERATNEFVFPLRHYHGITISINTAIAPKCFSCFLSDVKIQPTAAARKLCGENDCFVIRSKASIENIFSEMYRVPSENKKAYYKIKVLELLLVLSGIAPRENKLNPRTLSGAQVELAKRAAAYIAKHTDAQITISALSQKFHVSATHLQNAFKGVYGVPVVSFMRIHKMNAAALELIRTDRAVMEIAGEYGYDNASKFAAIFREIMGETPLEYRKAHRHIS